MVVTQSSKSLTRKTFIVVVNAYEKPTVTPKEKTVQSPIQQQQQSLFSGKDVGIDELRQHVGMLKTLNEQCIYMCNNGSDEVSMTLLSELIENEKPKLERVYDKKNGNLSLMHICAIRNKPMCMELLASHKVKIDGTDGTESTPLLHAVANNCLEAVAYLVTKGAAINHRDCWAKSALSIALKAKYYRVAEILATNHSLDVHLRGTKGNSVLHNCSIDGDLVAVQFLVENCNASPQRRNSDEENVLQYALVHPHIVDYLAKKIDKKTLLKMISSVNVMGSNILHECARYGYLDSLMCILKSVDLSDMTPHQVTDLLNAVDVNGDTPLLLAAKNGQVPMVRFLCQIQELQLNQGDNVNHTALHYAASQNNTQVVDMLISVCASFNADSKVDETDRDNLSARLTKSLGTLLAVILSSVAIVCLITIAAISIGFFGAYVGQSARSLRLKYFDEKFTHFSNQITEVDTVFDAAFANGVNRLNVTDERSVYEYIGPLFEIVRARLPIVTSVACTQANTAIASFTGSSFATSYANSSVYVTMEVIDRYNYSSISKSKVVSTVAVASRDIRNFPFMQDAKENRGTFWSLSTLSITRGTMYMYLGQGFRDPVTDEYLGACHFSPMTSVVDGYLKSAQGIKDSAAIIIERQTGYLIGSTDPSIPLYAHVNGTGIRYDGVTANENNQVVQAVLHARHELGGRNFPLLQNTTRLLTKKYFKGSMYAINVGRISNDRGLDWVMIESIPMTVFYGSFVKSIIIMCCVGVALIIFTIAVSIMLAMGFMKPIYSLIKQSESIKLLQLEKVEEDLKHLSYFTEIKSLQQAFQSMTSRLKQFRNFIPDHILSVIEVEVGAKKTHETLADQKTSDHSTESDSHVGTGLNNGDVLNKTLNSSLMSTFATVMTIKLPDYTTYLDTFEACDIDETNKEMLSQFMDIIRISKGQFVTINASAAVVVWNTIIRQSDHKVRACRAARNLVSALKKLHNEWKFKSLPLLDVSIGIASSNIYHGNLGTDRMKFYSVIGLAAQRSNDICQGSTTWDVQVFCDCTVRDSAKEEFYNRPLHTIVDPQSGQSSLVYELGEAKPTDGWSTEMENASKGDIWSVYNDAYVLYQDGHYDEAYELFVQYMEHHPTDTAAQNMLSMCKQQKDEVTPLSGTLSDTTVTLVEQ
jgi:ankyrin repeat protein/class 3 adenylate cyclase